MSRLQSPHNTKETAVLIDSDSDDDNNKDVTNVNAPIAAVTIAPPSIITTTNVAGGDSVASRKSVSFAQQSAVPKPCDLDGTESDDDDDDSFDAIIMAGYPLKNNLATEKQAASSISKDYRAECRSKGARKVSLSPTKSSFPNNSHSCTNPSHPLVDYDHDDDDDDDEDDEEYEDEDEDDDEGDDDYEDEGDEDSNRKRGVMVKSAAGNKKQRKINSESHTYGVSISAQKLHVTTKSTYREIIGSYRSLLFFGVGFQPQEVHILSRRFLSFLTSNLFLIT